MSLFSRILLQAALRPRRILFPESEAEAVCEACSYLLKENAALPVFLGCPDELDSALSSPCFQKKRPATIVMDEIILDKLAEEYVRTRGTLSHRASKRLMKNKLFASGMLLRLGEVDCVVAGLNHPTVSVIQAAGLTVGVDPYVSAPSSFFIMDLKHSIEGGQDLLFFADSAVQVAPSPKQLAEIGLLTAQNASRILPDFEPRVAFLSFSTLGSANAPQVEQVRNAVILARQRNPDLSLDGELQGDAALIPRVARKKKASDRVAGRANVLIFPDLNSGNIAYKLTQYLAQAQAIGPILQGFSKPFSDLSRGATSDDVIGVACITSLLV